MVKKAFSFDDYWASDIYRIQVANGDEYIAAHVRRKFDDYDVDDQGPGTLIGAEIVVVKRKITDTDQDSETFGKRIDDPEDDLGRTKRAFKTKFDAKSVKDYQKLVGTTRLGSTRLYYNFKNRAYEAEDVTQFWTGKMKDIYNEVVMNRQKILLEQKNGEE